MFIWIVEQTIFILIVEQTIFIWIVEQTIFNFDCGTSRAVTSYVQFFYQFVMKPLFQKCKKKPDTN